MSLCTICTVSFTCSRCSPNKLHGTCMSMKADDATVRQYLGLSYMHQTWCQDCGGSGAQSGSFGRLSLLAWADTRP